MYGVIGTIVLSIVSASAFALVILCLLIAGAKGPRKAPCPMCLQDFALDGTMADHMIYGHTPTEVNELMVATREGIR